MNLQSLIKKAENSPFWRFVLNFGLSRAVPFNRPHGFKITAITGNSIEVKIPYKTLNFNHIKGLHACGLATVTEYATGCLLLNKLDPDKYRLIMQKFEMQFHYQGKTDAFCRFSVSDDWMQSQIFLPIKESGAVIVECEAKIHDKNGNHLCTGKVFWQVKSWDKVKTQK